MTDRLLIRLYPLFNFFAVIGMLAGLMLFGMAVARAMGLIDMGPSFEAIEPVWMMAGGLGLVLTLWWKLRRIKAGVESAKSRVS